MTKDYADFLKIRAQAQESYGKSLIKLAKTLSGKDEIGTLRLAWESLRTETESIGQAHVSCANHILDEVNKVNEFMEVQREQRKKIEEGVRRTQANIKGFYKKVIECKKTYEIRNREADQAIKALAIESAKMNSIPKELEKLKLKQSKTTQSAEQADTSYRSAVDVLENSRQLWEHETETACDIFQQIEEDRIQHLRNSMWVVTNLESANCVAEDEIYEEIRKTLEKCDVDGDIQLFIRQRQTGSERPASIEFENYFGGQIERNESHVVTNKNLKNRSPDSVIQIHPLMFTSETKPAPMFTSIDNDAETLENAVYDSVYDTVTTTTLDQKRLCKVIYDFDGRNDEELSLREEAVVTLVREENADWWEVETLEGNKGYFPAIYLEIMA